VEELLQRAVGYLVTVVEACGECHADLGAADTYRINGRLTHGDDDGTERRLVEALRRLVAEAGSIERPPHVQLPQHPDGLELESVMTPRDAFFGRVEQVPVAQAAGRVAAEMLSPYPPGVPVLAPGERISQEALDYLTSGVAAGMIVPDAADPSLETVRVVAG
jgi:arginine/lysine/ornithine decarboxylase